MSKLRQNNIILSLLITSLTFSIFILSEGAFEMSNDDWTISCLLSQEYEGEFPCLFINSLLSFFVSKLYLLSSYCNWFFVVERVFVFLSIFLVIYILLKSKPGLICTGVFFAFISCFILPRCLLVGNFTVIAAFGSFSGAIGFLYLFQKHVTNLERSSVLILILSSIILIFSFLLRFEAACLSIPFFFICLLSILVHASKTDLIKSRLKLTSSIALIGVICFTLIAECIDFSIWQSPELSNWKNYNSARSRLADYPVPSYDSISTQLAEIEISENDYWLATNWTTDLPVFSTEKLEQISRICTEAMRADNSSLQVILGGGMAILSIL